MKTHKDQQKCPACKSSQIEVRHDRNVRYRYLKKDHVLEGQEHTVCLDCGLSFYQPGQIDRNNARFSAFEKSIVKGISPNEILTLREKYLITQEKATKIFHCGPTAFSKWERGETAPTATAALLLRAALEDPEIMKKFSELAGVDIDIPAVEKPEIHDHENTHSGLHGRGAVGLKYADYIKRGSPRNMMVIYDEYSYRGTPVCASEVKLVANSIGDLDEIMASWKEFKPTERPAVPSHYFAFPKR